MRVVHPSSPPAGVSTLRPQSLDYTTKYMYVYFDLRKEYGERKHKHLGLFVEGCRLSLDFRAFIACDSFNTILALCPWTKTANYSSVVCKDKHQRMRPAKYYSSQAYNSLKVAEEQRKALLIPCLLIYTRPHIHYLRVLLYKNDY